MDTGAHRSDETARFDTLATLCRALDCQPVDLLEFRDDGG
ncbi:MULTISPECIES: helix-turn-helix domain-containing protein [Meridianimarinicoccus]|nr:helix-turn-helix domain-containing protein [Phycocomes zhengii]